MVSVATTGPGLEVRIPEVGPVFLECFAASLEGSWITVYLGKSRELLFPALS